ncbi:MAG: hypothetical protein GY788_06295 [bacterium]|nr:hypothetical protein [bacterium]
MIYPQRLPEASRQGRKPPIPGTTRTLRVELVDLPSESMFHVLDASSEVGAVRPRPPFVAPLGG